LVFHFLRELFQIIFSIKNPAKMLGLQFSTLLQFSLFTLAIAVNNQIYYIAHNAISLSISADDLR